MNKTSKTYQAIKPLTHHILNGTMLCIDPSTGSQSSMPGYAIYKKGVLVEYGIIQVDSKLNRSVKLYEISRTIREDFDPADVLVVEYIPPVSYKGGMSSVAVMALQKGIGAIMAAHPYENMIEIPSSAWRNYLPDGYEKGDDWDAVAIGNCAVCVALEVVQNGDA